jgi:hypothetical protein
MKGTRTYADLLSDLLIYHYIDESSGDCHPILSGDEIFESLGLNQLFGIYIATVRCVS